MTPENPFLSADAGVVYARGRPYHHSRSLARIREYVGAAPVGRALDVASGTGMSALALAEHAAAVVAIEASAAMLRARIPHDRVVAVRGDAERLPFAAASFDAATCCSAVHWFDQERFFAELHRVLRPGAWVGLYDHYFIGIADADGFGEWATELLARYPLPPRQHQVGDPRAVTPAGFESAGDELFEDPIAMTPEEFADYQLSISNCVHAMEQGIARDEIRSWLLESTEPLFAGAPTRSVTFLGSIACLRRVP